jgi:hypothetical protein
MRRATIASSVTAAAALLAVPVAAGAHAPRPHVRAITFAAVSQAKLAGNRGLHLGWTSRGGIFERASGTASAFSGDTATVSATVTGMPLAQGTLAVTITTDWSKATDDKHGGKCAPATATETLTDAASSANTLSATVTGTTCAVGSNTWNLAAVFFGKATVGSAAGTLSGVTGTGRLLLVQKTDGTVKGFTFAGFRDHLNKTLTLAARKDAAKSGCSGK